MRHAITQGYFEYGSAKMEVKVKRLSDVAIMPTKATSGSACFDLYASQEEGFTYESSTIGTITAGTGLSFEIPDGYVMLIFSRSGHGFKENTRLANCVGVIDSDYRGEIKVKLTRDDGGRLHVINGDRIAQAMIIPVPDIELVEAGELSETARGAGGFGSTGK